jgi:predicted hydrocarbon binding protein/predicted transcriptional regulator
MKAKKRSDERSAELFATTAGIRAVDSPIRMKILSMLLEKEMSFDDIVASSGRVKSTISVHLKSLADDGIVSSRADPSDARKKFFFIDSSYLGGLSKKNKPDIDMEEYRSKYALMTDDPFEFFRLMFRSIRMSLLKDGIDLDPMLHDAGERVGEALYRKIEDPDIEKLLANMAAFWKSQKLGRIEIKSTSPLVIYIYDCFECQDLPFLGRPACAFDSGIIQAVFSRYYEGKARVIETNCYAMGDNYCRFVVDGEQAVPVKIQNKAIC